MTDLRQASQQALDALIYCEALNRDVEQQKTQAIHALRTALEQQQAEPVLQTCNCRWDGDVQVQQCTLHEAHVDAIHEWAERAKVAERKLAQQAEPVAAESITDAMMNLVDRLGSEWKQVDPQAWQHLLVYAPQQKADPVSWECKAGGLKPLSQRQYETQPANIQRHYTQIAPQRKPLTDEEIDQLLPEIVFGGSFTVITYGRAVARAVEAKIKEGT